MRGRPLVPADELVLGRGRRRHRGQGLVNLGIATDTPTGLLVPNIKDADTLGILDLSRELTRLTALARERKVAPADLTGGTITITNVGGFGVETGTLIINKPECAIVATGPTPPPLGGRQPAFAVRQLMTTRSPSTTASSTAPTPPSSSPTSATCSKTPPS